MKSAIIAACIVACACAVSLDQSAQVVRTVYDLAPEGNFQYGYETDNGISGQATGQVKAVGKEVALEVTGTNTYKDNDGQVFSITYVANENGYQPQGAHLPTPPAPEPIPEYIQRAIEYIKAHPYQEPAKL